MLTLRRFLAITLGVFLAFHAGCQRGEPVKTLLLHDSASGGGRRFDDVKVLDKRADYVKFRTPSGEVIEYTGRYTLKN